MKLKVKNKGLLIVALAASLTTVQAQQEHKLSVNDAVSLSLKNTVEIKNLRVDSLKQRAQNQRKFDSDTQVSHL